MTIKEPQTGKLFSELYLEKGDPRSDSARARLRVASNFCSVLGPHTVNFGELIERRLGIQPPAAGSSDYFWKRYFEQIKVRDFLDIITLVWQFLDLTDKGNAKVWPLTIGKIFSDENLGYRVDEKGGVHFSVDPQYEEVRAFAIASLVPAKYGAVRDAFAKAQLAMDRSPPDGKVAIRETFEAAETLFRLMFPATSRLGSTEVNSYLRPHVRGLHGGNQAAIDAANQFVSAFSDWVNGAHQYRHGQAVEEPTPPPLPFAVAMVSSGAAYLRWLAELDKSGRGKPDDEA